MDAPEVTVFSVPDLGLSMELETYNTYVWEVLRSAVCEISKRVDYYGIACNTLNYYASKIAALGIPARLVSMTEVITRDVQRHSIKKLVLLGAKPVTEFGAWSPFDSLKELADVEVPANTAALHQLICDIKIYGGEGPGVEDRFAAILDTVKSDYVILACTELPLIPLAPRPKRLVDVTRLLADELVRLSLDDEWAQSG